MIPYSEMSRIQLLEVVRDFVVDHQPVASEVECLLTKMIIQLAVDGCDETGFKFVRGSGTG